MGGFALMSLTACAANAADNRSYTLTVAMPQVADNAMVYLMNFDLDAKADSAFVADGQVVFTGQVETPYMGRVVVNGNRGAMFVVEPGVITVDALGNVEGTETNRIIEDFSAQMAELGAQYRNLPLTASDADRQAVIDKVDELTRNAMEANAANPFGAYLFLQGAYDMTPEQLAAALDKYPQFADYPRVRKIQNTYERKEKTSAGNMFTDFAVEYEGKTTRLSDYVGKGHPVLVDFWASWCGPCRRESAVLKDIYAKYRQQGLEILGVAVWDEPDNSVEAVEDLVLPWPQIINGQTEPTDLYGILGIPCIIMFDGDGKILFRDLQGDDLRAAVDKVMADAAAE